MNLTLGKKEMGILIFSILFLALLAITLFYLIIGPLNKEIDRKETDLKMANQELKIIDGQLKQTNKKVVTSSMELQKQVPVKRLLDQLILDIVKAEVISDTNILEIKLNGTAEDENVSLINEETGTVQLDEVSKIEEEENAIVSDDEDTTSTPEETKNLPTGIKKTTIVMVGEADTYFDLEKFITVFQDLQRIIKVDTMKFSGREEIYSLDQPMDPIDFEITISAYYYPELTNLQNELPPLDTPSISNKKNPISGFSDVDGDEGNQDREETTP